MDRSQFDSTNTNETPSSEIERLLHDKEENSHAKAQETIQSEYLSQNKTFFLRTF